MKHLKFRLIVALCSIGLTSAAQTDTDYAALADFLPANQLAELESNNPLRYQQMAYLNRNGYYISQVGEKSSTNFPSAFEVEKRFDSQPDITLSLIESGELNLLGYELEYSRDRYTYYRLDDNGTVLVILPLNLLYKRANIDLN